MRNCAEWALLAVFISLIYSAPGCGNTDIERDNSYKIIVAYEPIQEIKEDSIPKLEYCAINEVGSMEICNKVKPIFSGKKMRWEFFSKGPVMIKGSLGVFQLLSPGDSINIIQGKDGLAFSGKGAVKTSLWYEVRELDKNTIKPTKNSFRVKSLAEYLIWNDYLDNLLQLQIPILDAQKENLQKDEYNYLKSMIVESAEHDRTNAFIALMGNSIKDTTSRITGADLCAIWDSTQYKKYSNWLRSIPAYHGPMHTHYAFNQCEVYRRFNFDLTVDSLMSKDMRTYLYYASAKNKYEGQIRERLMAYILDEQTIGELGLKNVMTQMMLKDYYSMPGFPEYKAWVKGLEKNAQ